MCSSRTAQVATGATRKEGGFRKVQARQESKKGAPKGHNFGCELTPWKACVHACGLTFGGQMHAVVHCSRGHKAQVDT